LIGVFIAAIPLIIYFAVNAGHSYLVALAVCAIPIVLTYIIVSLRTTLIFIVGMAFIVRESVGPRAAFDDARVASLFRVGESVAPLLPCARACPASFPCDKPLAFLQLRQIDRDRATSDTSDHRCRRALLAISMTYDEYLSARFQGADLIAAAERLLPEPAAS
jgi:hypothetical protein